MIYFLYIYLFAFQIFPSFHVLDRVNYSNPPFSVLLTIDFILRRRKALLPNGFITDFQQAKLFDLYTTLLSPTTNHNFACMYNDLLGTFESIVIVYTHSMRIHRFSYGCWLRSHDVYASDRWIYSYTLPASRLFMHYSQLADLNRRNKFLCVLVYIFGFSMMLLKVISMLCQILAAKFAKSSAKNSRWLYESFTCLTDIEQYYIIQMSQTYNLSWGCMPVKYFLIWPLGQYWWPLTRRRISCL